MSYYSALALMAFCSMVTWHGGAMAADPLMEQFFGTNVPAGTTTSLPDDGSTQAFRMRGVGTQNYLCVKNDDGSYEWALQFPLAGLWLYDSDGNVDTSRDPDGMHYFADIGSGAGWDLGTNCDPGTNPTDRSCDTTRARWRGKKVSGDPAPDGSIAWLLVEKDEENMPPMVDGEAYNEMWIFNWMQRLDTSGGQPSGTCESDGDVGNTDASQYECDYVLALTPKDYAVGAPEEVQLPDNCFQTTAWQGEGIQEYQFWDDAWILSQPLATLRAFSTVDPMIPIEGDEGLVGYHFFANVGDSGTAGSGAGWVVGKDCDVDTCSDLAGSWRGIKEAGVGNPDGVSNIALLLVYQDEDNTPASDNILKKYGYMQRLMTVDGVPPSEDGTQGERFQSDYTCAYVLSLCVEETMDPTMEPTPAAPTPTSAPTPMDSPAPTPPDSTGTKCQTTLLLVVVTIAATISTMLV